MVKEVQADTSGATVAVADDDVLIEDEGSPADEPRSDSAADLSPEEVVFEEDVRDTKPSRKQKRRKHGRR